MFKKITKHKKGETKKTRKISLLGFNFKPLIVNTTTFKNFYRFL